MAKFKPPNDRIRSLGSKSNLEPEIQDTIRLKIPDKEVHIMQASEQAPGGDGGGTCSCHSVCTCVPVSSCTCNMVCTCDTVCSTDLCSCNPYYGCSPHTCSCVPVCQCDSDCTTCSTCSTCTTGGHYWHPC
jgi:hypothetical protein